MEERGGEGAKKVVARVGASEGGNLMGGFDRKWEENGQRDENALPIPIRGIFAVFGSGRGGTDIFFSLTHFIDRLRIFRDA